MLANGQRTEEGTNLRQRRFVDAVDVGFGLRLNLLPQGFVTHGAVDQRLQQHTKRRGEVPAGGPPRRACRRTHTHPVGPVAAARDVRRPLGTVGGFEVEVVVDEGHAESRLQERGQPVAPEGW